MVEQGPPQKPDNAGKESSEFRAGRLLTEAHGHARKIYDRFPHRVTSIKRSGGYSLGPSQTNGNYVLAETSRSLKEPHGQFELSIEQDDTDTHTVLKFFVLKDGGIEAIGPDEIKPSLIKKKKFIDELYTIKTRLGDENWPLNITLPQPIDNSEIDQTEEDVELFKKVVSGLASQEFTFAMNIQASGVVHDITYHTTNEQPLYVRYVRAEANDQALEHWDFYPNDEVCTYNPYGYASGIPHDFHREQDIPEVEKIEPETKVKDLDGYLDEMTKAAQLIKAVDVNGTALHFPNMTRGLAYLQELANVV